MTPCAAWLVDALSVPHMVQEIENEEGNGGGGGGGGGGGNVWAPRDQRREMQDEQPVHVGVNVFDEKNDVSDIVKCFFFFAVFAGNAPNASEIG